MAQWISEEDTICCRPRCIAEYCRNGAIPVVNHAWKEHCHACGLTIDTNSAAQFVPKGKSTNGGGTARKASKGGKGSKGKGKGKGFNNSQVAASQVQMATQLDSITSQLAALTIGNTSANTATPPAQLATHPNGGNLNCIECGALNLDWHKWCTACHQKEGKQVFKDENYIKQYLEKRAYGETGRAAYQGVQTG